MKHTEHLTQREIDWAYEKWCEGYRLDQIADALYCNVRTISRAFRKHGCVRIRPVLKCPEHILGVRE